MSDIRYEIGQQVPFVRVDYDPCGNASFSGLYLPWLHKLLAIHVDLLTCEEHHKVRWHYDHETDPAKYDGFVFRDQEGTRWFNQYPYANYGQTDDSANYRAIKEGETDLSRVSTDGFQYLSNMWRGIEQLTAQNDVAAADSLRKHFDQVKALIEAEAERQILISPLVMTSRDGHSTTVPGHYDAAFAE